MLHLHLINILQSAQIFYDRHDEGKQQEQGVQLSLMIKV